mgnify:CR=1 FL=1
MLKTVIVYERPEALEVKLITKFLDEFIISLFLAEAIKIQIILEIIEYLQIDSE